MQSVDGSAVDQTVRLKPGQTFSRSLFIPAWKVDPEEIRLARRRLVSYMTPVVARAREYKDRPYQVHTTTAFTKSYDVIVTGVVVIAEEEDEI